MGNLRIWLSPEQRKTFNSNLLHGIGLGDILEICSQAYGAIPLANVNPQLSPENKKVKTVLELRQEILKRAMADAGITLYDPNSAPFSPDNDLSASPAQVTMVDTGKIAGARHVTYVDLIPSTGCGKELNTAETLSKFIYVIHDPNIRTSRMQPTRTFHLCIADLAAARDDLTAIFKYVNEHDPCPGFDGDVPVMLGIHRKSGELVYLERLVAERWPHLVYDYERLGMKDKLTLPFIYTDTSLLIESAHQATLAA